MRPPVLICISDTSASYWIVLAHLITGIILFTFQGQAAINNYRGIGIWWECVLFADVFFEFMAGAGGLGGFESPIESALYMIVFLKTFRFGFYCVILLTILLMDFYSNKSELFLESVMSKFALLETNESSLQIGDYLSMVFIMSLIIYPIESAVNAPPSTRAIIYMIYLPLSMVFQGLSAVIVWRRVAEIRQIEFSRSVLAWMSKRSTRISGNFDRGESSRDETPAPRMIVSQERCTCCPQFDFGCLQKLQIVEDEDEDDY